MDESELLNLLLRETDWDDDDMVAYADALERRGQAGQELTGEVVDILVGLIQNRRSFFCVDPLISAWQRWPMLLSRAQSERLNQAIKQADGMGPYFFSPQELGQKIRQALASRDGDQMLACAEEFDEYCSGLKHHTDASINLIVELLGDPEFPITPFSWYLINQLYFGWNRVKLTARQSTRVLRALESAYYASADPMWCLVIGEILGIRYADKQAFIVLSRLAHGPVGMPRSLVPNALDHLARQTGDPDLARRATGERDAIPDDLSPEVVTEILRHRTEFFRHSRLTDPFDSVGLSQSLRQAVASGDSEQMNSSATEFYGHVEDLEQYPDAAIDLIVELLDESAFRAARGSWHLLNILGLGYLLGQLSEDQKERLLPAFEAAYHEFADPMSCLLIGEMLGASYADERAFAVLSRLTEGPEGTPRSLVPNAWDQLARSAKDPTLATRAGAARDRMPDDPSPEVVAEVLEHRSEIFRHFRS